MEIVKRAGNRHKVQFFKGNQEEGNEFAKFTFGELCRRFSEEAHIKPKYVRYIINSFLKVVKQMILEGKIVKLPGLGDFYLGLNYAPLRPRYTPLYKKYIYQGRKPSLMFKVSKKFKEFLIKEACEQDAYEVDPIAFDFRPSKSYVFYYIDKNSVLREVERLHGRTERPKPMYTPEDIDRLCLEYCISYPEYAFPYKTEQERKDYYRKRYIKEIEEGKWRESQ